MQFSDLNLHRSLLEAIKDKGYDTPTQIQQQAIPEILEGNDIVGCAQTGTGKTAAFAIPILEVLHPIVGSAKKRKFIRTVVVTPTRELAMQIQANFDEYGKYMTTRSLVLFGGVNQNPQVDALKEGVDIVITTPGRFLDLYKQGFISLDQMHHLVIDEADLMLDMGFINDVKKIAKLAPENRQTLLFSATMPFEIRVLADSFLKNPKYIIVDPVTSTSNNIKQSVYFVEKEDKKKLLAHIITEDNIEQAIVFVRTKHGADNVVKYLEKQNEVKKEQLLSVLHYIKDNKTCKNRLVLDYFGEETKENCGICSYCITQKGKITEADSIADKILYLLKATALTSREIETQIKK